MDLESDNKLLQAMAEGGLMDYAIWPSLLIRLIPRLQQIARTEFPIPSSSHQPFSHPYTAPSQLPIKAESVSQLEIVSSQITTSSSQSADKENAPPNALQPNTSGPDNASDIFPLQVITLLNSITKTLTAYFSQYPPHTVQRLCELILTPKAHYQSLLSYLHAVDRVVHVTSGANIYPLPAAIEDSKALPNGTVNGTEPDLVSWDVSTHIVPGLGSDESLGGALLTPIPWLRAQIPSSVDNESDSNQMKKLEGEVKTESTQTIDGPNGAGSLETVSISVNGIVSTTPSSAMNSDSHVALHVEGGVTQGELLRQEQCAGVIPAAQLTYAQALGEGSEGDEIPHARGPEEIGMEDMGPQVAGTVGVGMQGIDVEAAVGRRSEEQEVSDTEVITPTTPKREADEQLGSSSKRVKEEAEDENMELVGADGQSVRETKLGEGGENFGPDAIKPSTI